MKQLARLIIVALLVAFLGVALGVDAQSPTLTLFELAELLKQDSVASITVRGDVDVVVELRDGSTYQFTKQMEDNLFGKLMELGVTTEHLVQVEYTEMSGDHTRDLTVQLLVSFIPAALLFLILTSIT